MKKTYQSNHKKGFTLIELLIVIALLGALAVGLLAALDPFEQLKKGTDTGVRNTVSEVHGGIIRYYAIKNEMPWQTVNSAVTEITPTNLSDGYTDLGLSYVITSGELKSDFSVLAGNQLRHITLAGSEESVTVCFKPTSKSFRSDPNTKYDPNTLTELSGGNTACGDPSDPNFSCLWCVR